MGVFPIGNDTVGIVKRTKTVGRDRYNQPVAGPATVIPKQGCSFEVQPAAAPERREALDATGTVLEMVAFVTLPVDDDTVAIDFADAIQFPYPGGPVYEQAGRPDVTTTIRGQRDHVELVVAWQAG